MACPSKSFFLSKLFNFVIVKMIEAKRQLQPTGDKVMRGRIQELDRDIGRYAEAFSHVLWPWKEGWLLLLIMVFSNLDFISTFAALNLSSRQTYESGLLASWALEHGGFSLLYLVDFISVLTLALFAMFVRYAYARKGFHNYGRAAFVCFLAPYLSATAFAIINNVVLALI